MQPENKNPQDIQPVGPPTELPRPRVRMSDIRPVRPISDIRTDAVNNVQSANPNVQATSPVDAPASTQTTPATPVKQVHPGDHLLEAPHEPLLGDGAVPERPKKKRSKVKVLLYSLFVLVLLAAVAAATAVWWYQQQLTPVTSGDAKQVRLTVQPGSSPAMIADNLKEAGLIRSQLAFTVYVKLSGTQDTLKAGTYSLKPNESVAQIVEHLVAGKQDTFSLTFLPGDTLANNRKKLIDAGYEPADVDAALTKTYDRPLFEGKPASADLEGYIFGETYEFSTTATVESILAKTFDEYENYITKNNIVSGLKKQNLTLYQGITLASIVQKEVSGPEDSRQVAQVFFSRIKQGMPLGADATFVFAAKKEGRQPTVDFDSLYNTRIHKGLPPGPISVPGANALLAVTNPAAGDFLYFVSGDDGKNYFSRTLAEHEANTRAHCKKNCSLF